MSISRYNMPQTLQRLNCKLLYISASKYEGDWQSAPHLHPFSELIYITSGRGFFLLDGKRYPLEPHDLLIIPPHTEHTEQSIEDAPLEYLVLGIEGIELLDPKHPNEHLLSNYADTPSFFAQLSFLLQEAQGQRQGYQQICQNVLEILLLMILRQQQVIPTSVSTAKMTKECSSIQRYLDTHFSECIHLDGLAKMAHMNKYYLVHAFTHYTGHSPMNYLMQKRLQAGQDLLATTNYSIAQISSLIGLSSQSYFSQVFRKNYGMSPNEYRRQHAKEAKKEATFKHINKV
ncbi:MAG: AraC family transcriptional regulator [bacterium]|nr:AraC family transcriptional regulator [bacterium]